MSCNNKFPCLNRRRFVLTIAAGTAAFTGGAARADRPPDAPPEDDKLVPNNGPTAFKKSTKQAAGYVERTGPSPQTCVLCHNFIDPNECIYVEGYVNPWGWCDWGVD